MINKYSTVKGQKIINIINKALLQNLNNSKFKNIINQDLIKNKKKHEIKKNIKSMKEIIESIIQYTYSRRLIKDV